MVAPFALFYVVRFRSRLEVHTDHDHTGPRFESQGGRRTDRASAGR
jgi:hypothetical protein